MMRWLCPKYHLVLLPSYLFILRQRVALVSNVPGPVTRVYWGHAKVKRISFFSPVMGKIGLVVGMFSYADEVCLNVLADESSMPNPKEFLDYILKEMEILKLAAKESPC